MDTQTWQQFEDPIFALRFHYPAFTPGGHPVEMDEVRVHFRSQASAELYFEISRHLDLSAQQLYEREKAFVEDRLDEGTVSELQATTVAGHPAFIFAFQWDKGERTLLLIEKPPLLYRVIYDSTSPLTRQVIATLEIL